MNLIPMMIYTRVFKFSDKNINYKTGEISLLMWLSNWNYILFVSANI